MGRQGQEERGRCGACTGDPGVLREERSGLVYEDSSRHGAHQLRAESPDLSHWDSSGVGALEGGLSQTWLTGTSRV